MWGCSHDLMAARSEGSMSVEVMQDRVCFGYFLGFKANDRQADRQTALSNNLGFGLTRSMKTSLYVLESFFIIFSSLDVAINHLEL